MTPAPLHALRCAFCRRTNDEVPAMVRGPHRLAGLPVAICYDCAASALDEMLGVLVASDVANAIKTGQR